jgi:hypothetical protein
MGVGFSRYWITIERKMGTPARFMAPKSVMSDQPTIKATSPHAESLGFREFANEGYL